MTANAVAYFFILKKIIRLQYFIRKLFLHTYDDAGFQNCIWLYQSLMQKNCTYIIWQPRSHFIWSGGRVNWMNQHFILATIVWISYHFTISISAPMMMRGHFFLYRLQYVCTKKAMHHVYNIRTYGSVCIAKMWAAYLNIIFDMCVSFGLCSIYIMIL